VLAVFTGSALRLYVDGKQDGADVPIHGLRSDKESAIGGPALWANGIRAAGFLQGDLGSFRVLQRYLTPEEIAAIPKDRASGKPVGDLRLQALRPVVAKSAQRTNP
jgi:hypothetical protein